MGVKVVLRLDKITFPHRRVINWSQEATIGYARISAWEPIMCRTWGGSGSATHWVLSIFDHASFKRSLGYLISFFFSIVPSVKFNQSNQVKSCIKIFCFFYEVWCRVLFYLASLLWKLPNYMKRPLQHASNFPPSKIESPTIFLHLGQNCLKFSSIWDGATSIFLLFGKESFQIFLCLGQSYLKFPLSLTKSSQIFLYLGMGQCLHTSSSISP